jgi:hypothetical protein
VWRGFAFDPGTRGVTSLGRPRARRRVARGGVRPSSEVENRLRGVLGPRARRRIARGGVRPSSEAEFTSCGTLSSSEAETHPRGTAASRLVGRYGFFGPWAFPLWVATTQNVFLGFVACSFCVLLFFERGVSPVIRGPLWLSTTVAPEPLRWYLLGTRRG